jgi:hypothetical protein
MYVWRRVYLVNVSGFDTNLHVAARGLVFFLYAVAPHEKQIKDEKEITTEAYMQSLLTEPLSPQSLLYQTMEMCSKALMQCSKGDVLKSSGVEKRLFFLEALYRDMEWMGEQHFEKMVPNFLIKSSKLSAWK